MDDALIQKLLEDALGDRKRAFDTTDPDAVERLEAYESILYSLDKRDLVGLLDVMQAFSTILNPRLALHCLVKKVTEILDISHCSMILLNLREETGTVAVSHEDPDFEGVRISLGDYPEILRSLQTGNITVVGNPSMDPLMHSLKQDQMSRIKDVSIMVLPLLFDGRVFGVLLVRKQVSDEGFSIREVRICQLMVKLVLSTLRRMYRAGIQPLPAGEQEPAGECVANAGSEGTPDLHRALFSLGPVGVLLLDEEDRILEANPKASELLGIGGQTLLRMHFGEIVPDEWVEQIRRMRKVIPSGEKGLRRYNYPYRSPDGQEKKLSVQRHPFATERAHTLIFFRDATKEKQMEDHLQLQADELTLINRSLQEARTSLLKQNEELQATNERLEELNKSKTHFLAVATHEIRTPLSIIMGYNRFMLQEKAGELNPEQKRILDESVQSCERLLNIVNEMLDFSRIESGKLELQNRQSDVLVLLRRVYRQMKIIAERDRIDLALDVPEEPIQLFYDPDRIEQVLVNLISNAIKFTEGGGGITLSARRRQRSVGGCLEISVSDTGVGLSRSLLETVFTNYQPLLSKGPGPSSQQGVGLGLAISKKIVEAHGGEIWAESEEGEGATFRFTIPFPMRDQDMREGNLSA